MTEVKSKKKPKDSSVEVAKAIEEVKLEMSGQEDNLITLSTGVIVRLKAVPPIMLIKAMSSFTPPPMPTFWNEETQQHYVNPDHPGYIEDMKAHENKNNNRLADIMISYGVEIIEIPDGFSKPDTDEWVEKLELNSFETLPDNNSWRELMWLTTQAIENADDFSRISKVIETLSGVPEEDVEAAARFPGSDEENRDSA